MLRCKHPTAQINLTLHAMTIYESSPLQKVFCTATDWKFIITPYWNTILPFLPKEIPREMQLLSSPFPWRVHTLAKGRKEGWQRQQRELHLLGQEPASWFVLCERYDHTGIPVSPLHGEDVKQLILPCAGTRAFPCNQEYHSFVREIWNVGLCRNDKEYVNKMLHSVIFQ